MSELEDKILGKEKKVKPLRVQKDVFGTDMVWSVKKNGCGQCLFNGRMIYEMISPEGKAKARKGVKKFTDGNFVFELQNREGA